MFLYIISPSCFMENTYKIGFTNNIHETYVRNNTYCGNAELIMLIRSDKADIMKLYIHNKSPIITLQRGERKYLDGVFNINYESQFTYKNNPNKFVNTLDFYYISNFDMIVDMCKIIDKDLEIIHIPDLEFMWDMNMSTKINLYYYQQEFVNKFNLHIETRKPLNGILQMATGTGKTITLLSCLNNYWNIYNIHKPCLWISIQNNILDSQEFYNVDKYPFLKEKVIKLSNGGMNINFEKYKDKQVLFILLRQTLTTRDNVDKIPSDYLGGIFYDEIHDGINSSLSETYKGLIKIKETNELHFFIGASATPLTLYRSQIDNMTELFDCDKKSLILHNYSYHQAVIDKILIPYCIKFMTTINQIFYNIFVEKIQELPTKKILLYFPTLEIRDKYIEQFTIKLSLMNVDVNIWKTDAKYTDYDDKFINDKVEIYTLMFACDKFKVGTDISDLSMIVDYTGTGIPSVINMIQKCGRLTRKDKEKCKENSEIKPCYWLIHENKQNYSTIYYNYIKYLSNDFYFDKELKELYENIDRENDNEDDIKYLLDNEYENIYIPIEFEETQLTYKEIITDIIVKENQKRQYNSTDTIRIKSVRKLCLLYNVKNYSDYIILRKTLLENGSDIIPEYPEDYFSKNKNYKGFYQLILDEKEFEKIMKRKYNPLKYIELKAELQQNKVTKEKYELYRIQNDMNKFPTLNEIENRYFACKYNNGLFYIEEDDENLF